MLWNEKDRRILRELFPQSFAAIDKIEKKGFETRNEEKSDGREVKLKNW